MNLILGNKYFQPFFRKLFFLSLKGMNYNRVGSGEMRAFQFARKDLAKENLSIFDVGSNVGQFANDLLPLISTGSILYCFEPQRSAFNQLVSSLSDSRLHFFNQALGNENGMKPIFKESESSTLASFFDRSQKDNGQEELVKIQRLDDFCEIHGISHIDYLKIDVEGFEYAVLLGASGLIRNKAIAFIQFEFGGTQVDSRTFFKDFWELLSPDFQLYRILSNGLLEITRYSEFLEIFAYSNFLARRK